MELVAATLPHPSTLAMELVAAALPHPGYVNYLHFDDEDDISGFAATMNILLFSVRLQT